MFYMITQLTTAKDMCLSRDLYLALSASSCSEKACLDSWVPNDIVRNKLIWKM